MKHAFRMLAKSLGSSAIVIATLALGIGANTAVFSIVEGVLLRPPPYRDAARLINILDTSPREKELAKIFASYADFEEYSRHAHTLESLAAITWAARPGAILTGRGPAKMYLTLPVTADFFATLGVEAERGRTFRREDLRGGCAVVLSNKFWRGPLHADPSIVGQSLSLDERACAVLGVMPPRFAFYPEQTQIWRLLLPDEAHLENFFGVFIVGRLTPGATGAQALAELTALHAAFHAQDAREEKEFVPLVDSLQNQFTWLAGRSLRTTLAVLFAAVFLVLAIACLNVAHLLLGRSLARSREFAIRAALGSGAARLARQLFTETALLCAAGGALGLLVAFAAVRVFVHAQPVELPVGAAISIRVPALVFTAAISMLTAVIFAIVPAWAASRADLQAGLRGVAATGGRQRLSRFLVAVEMALSVILLAAAGLLIRSVVNFGSAPLGFAQDHLILANGSLPRHRYPDTGSKVAFYDELQRRLASLPGVHSATIASTLPPYGLGLDALEVRGISVAREAQKHDVGQASVGDDYFRVLEIPLRRGRVFNAQDRPQSDPVAVVSEALAREYFAARDPIGEQIRVGGRGDWLTIVGVVGDELAPQVFHEMSWAAEPAVYRPVSQNPPGSFSLALAGAVEQPAIGHVIEQAAGSIDGEVPVGDPESMRARLAPYLKYPRFRAVVLGAFSALAMLLAAVGLYGVLAQFVTERTREIGVRMAVGAGPGRIAAMVVRKAGLPVLAGLIAGFALAFALTRYISSLLYQVTPADPATLGLVGAVMMGIAGIAMLIPAKRASRVDPIIALRSE